MQTCPHCNAQQPVAARFCDQCGGSVAPTRALEPQLDGLGRWADALSPNGAPGNWLLGRDDDVDIGIRNPVVSSQHLRITREGDRWILVDQGSTNGTFVDGRRLEPNRRVQVFAESRIHLGSVELSPGVIVAGTERAHIQIEATGDLVIGRDDEADITLSAPSVSRRHAVLQKKGAGWAIKDLGSANGTWVNGKRIRGTIGVQQGDRIELGAYRLDLEAVAGDRAPVIRSTHYANELRLDVDNVSLFADNGYQILHDVSLSVYPGELVLLMGPSGAGKSTLMYTMNGYANPQRGQIRINGLDLYENHGFFKSLIGYVPQKEIMPRTLTAREVLTYAGQLRLPKDVVDKRVEEVLDSLGILERADVRVGKDGERGCLSGGQQKRVNMGIELMPDPGILFLDEPTSGLDSRAAMTVLQICRDLADRGKPVVMTIHQPRVEAADLADNIILMKHGRLSYYGPLRKTLYTFFEPHYKGPALHPNVTGTDLAIDALDPKPEFRAPGEDDDALAETWKARYNQHELRTTYVDQRLEAGTAQTGAGGSGSRPKGGLAQLSVLTRRYFHMLRKETMDVALLAVQAPVIAVLLYLLFSGQDLSGWTALEFTPVFDVDPATGEPVLTNAPETPSPKDFLSPALFLAGAAAFWFGCNNAARELVRERPLFMRERKQGLTIGAYLGSKVLLQYLIVTVQAAVLTGTLIAMKNGLEHPVEVMAVLTLTGWSGVGVGMAISSWARTEFFAVLLVPLVVLPQIMVGGLLVEYANLPDALQVFSDHVIVLRSSFDSLTMLELPHLAEGPDRLELIWGEGVSTDAEDWLRRMPWLGAWIVVPMLFTLLKLSREET